MKTILIPEEGPRAVPYFGTTQPYGIWTGIVADVTGKHKIFRKIRKIDEYLEALGTILWLPLIKRVVAEAAANRCIHPDHQNLFENLLFGLTAVETTGKFAQTGNFGATKLQEEIGSFRGLSQMVPEKHYLEENLYDPLTALRVGLRNSACFVYNSRSVEAALGEHNNGKSGIGPSRTGVDAFCTIGQEFAMRVVNAAWWGYHIIKSKNCLDDIEYYFWQFDEHHQNARYYRYAPPWPFLELNEQGRIVINEPDLPFNWIPPHTSLGFQYINHMPGKNLDEKREKFISQTLQKDLWTQDVEFEYPDDKKAARLLLGNPKMVLRGIQIPQWFYEESIAPDIKPLVLTRLPEEEERKYYPFGAWGKTPAKSGENHNLYLQDNDILQDIIGRDRQGTFYFYPREHFST